MFGLQETTETCATTTAQGTHEEEEEQATGLHRQPSGSTHTDMRTRTFPELGYSQVLRCRRHEKRRCAGCMTSTAGERQAAYPTAARGASAGTRHPAQKTMCGEICVRADVERVEEGREERTQVQTWTHEDVIPLHSLHADQRKAVHETNNCLPS